MEYFYSIIFIICILNSSECSLFDRLKYNNDLVKEMLTIRITNATPPMDMAFNMAQVVDSKEGLIRVSNTELRFEYAESTNLIVSKWTDDCLAVNYSSNVQTDLIFFVNVAGQHLYGGSEETDTQWPYKIFHDEKEFVSRLNSDAGVLEPYWVLSNGYYIYVDNRVPLFLEKFGSTFRIKAKHGLPYVKREKLALNYVICKQSDINQAQKHAVRKFLGKPTTVPDERLVTHPMWSTQSKFGTAIDQKTVLEFAQDIARNGFAGQLRIDRTWEECPGSLKPNDNFAALKNLTDDLKKLNFTVALAIDALVGYKCGEVYDEGVKNNYFVKNDKNDTSVTGDESGDRVVDLTNPEARNWFLKRLQQLRDTYGIDSFKFDNLFSSTPPQPPVYQTMTEYHPETLLKESAKLLASLNSSVQTSVARNMQKYGFLVRMVPRTTSWDSQTTSGRNVGLKTIVPTLLQLNILGYSFVVPDKIGGDSEYDSILESSELYIRWTQLNVFMPYVEFSVPPWEFDDPRVLPIVKKFLELRAEYAYFIIDLMHKHVETGDPVNRPLWWITPRDEEALKCDNEFLLGDGILVAPVLEKGGRKRNIYLPPGLWKDGNSETTYTGPRWLNDYPAPLEVLPYFINMQTNTCKTTAFGKTFTTKMGPACQLPWAKVCAVQKPNTYHGVLKIEKKHENSKLKFTSKQ